MWPVLLNMTRDECRFTLRRLELEAYSNMVNVFRAQGALEDNRKKLLEELRAALHISQDRHSAEARRVSNDQLLATIAEQISGPNTGIAWICEGRRRVPLLPRGIPQTAYTEIADKAAEAAAAENKEIQKRLATEKLIASKINEEEMTDVEGYNQEGLTTTETMDDAVYTPIAMEDQTIKLWETELITRKRKPEGVGTIEDFPPPIKNMRNIPVNTNQKHLNLSQLYSKFSQPATSKQAGQSKHSYNQVSKVSTSKSSQPHAPRSTPHKPRAQKTPKLTKAQKKAQAQAQEIHTSPGKYNASMPLEYAGPPNTFQASYAQAVLGGKTDFVDELKSKGMSDSPTMQLLTQPTTLPHELEVSENSHHISDEPSLHAQSTPVLQPAAPKPAHLIVKHRGDSTPDKKQKSDVKIVQRPSDIKLLSNKQMVVAPSHPAAQKTPLNTPGKLVTTKVIGSIPKSRGTNTPVMTEKMIVVSKPTPEHKNPPSAKVIVTSSANTHTPNRERTFSANNPIHRITETLTPKGLPATDLKVSAKALVLNPKSGQKMVVVPASKARTKPEGKIPLIHFKGISTAMKLLPVGSQPQVTQVAKSAAIQVISKPTAQTKVMGMDSIPIKTANLADIVPVKGMAPSTQKITNPIVRPSSTKGNVIVVQKGTHIGKALAFAKNGNDMSKIIMGKNVTQLLQASKTEHTDAAKSAGNVIVLELNNEQSGRPTTMSEILDSRSSGGGRVSADKKLTPITPDTPVLFDTRMTDETCNASSLDSTTESIGGIVVDAGITMLKDEAKSSYSKDEDNAKDSSSVTDWEMELDTVVESKDKDDDDDKLNSLHLDLGMSSDSDSEYLATGRKTQGKHSQGRQRATTSGESGEVYSSSSAMSVATRTLLSQLQDDGSSSNDSSFALRAKISRKRDSKLDRTESDELTKAKEKLSEKVRDARSQQKRIDIYSTAITPSDINLDSFAYLEEGILVGDDVFATDEGKRERRTDTLDDQLSRLLGDDLANSNDSQPKLPIAMVPNTKIFADHAIIVPPRYEPEPLHLSRVLLPYSTPPKSSQPGILPCSTPPKTSSQPGTLPSSTPPKTSSQPGTSPFSTSSKSSLVLRPVSSCCL